MLLTFSFLNGLHAQCTHPDYDGLMELYQSTNSEGWIADFGWFQGLEGESCNPCNYQGTTWARVTCQNNRVTGLNLTAFNLSGELPDIELEFLEYLDIRENNLSGSIPDFSKMPALNILVLKDNNLQGTLPTFNNIPKMTRLTIEDENITGGIPDYSHLSELVVLELSNNKLDGEISELRDMPFLFQFVCDNNQLVGNIPNFENCPSLQFIQCGINKLSGPVPDLSHLPNFDNLFMVCNFNELEGCYPESICDMGSFIGSPNPNLPWSGIISQFCNGEEQVGAPCSAFDIPFPFIQEDCTCYTSPCDDFHPDFDSLMDLYDATNGDDWIDNDGWWQGKAGISCNPCVISTSTGVRPWYGVSCINNRVVCVDLDGNAACDFNGTEGNNLRGILPNMSLTHLQTLNLDHNHLEGGLPDLTGCVSLKNLLLSFNNLDGTIVKEDLPHLIELRLGFNDFAGSLDALDSFDSLYFFSGTDNNFSGCFPDRTCEFVLFDVAGNLELPWSGLQDKFCDGEPQVGAPCFSKLTQEAGFINSDCLCDVSSSVFELNKPLIYPNPSSNTLHLKEIDRILEYEICDIDGKVLKNGQLRPTKSTIDLVSLNSGLYFLFIKSEFRTEYVHKFSKI